MAANFGQGPVLPEVSTLPAASSNANRLLVQGGKPWYSDGTSWIDMTATGGGSGYAQNVLAGNITLVSGDDGTTFVKNTTTARTINLPGTVFSNGWKCRIVNSATSANITVARGSLSLHVPGIASLTSNRVLGPNGIATLEVIDGVFWFIGGGVA